MANFNKTCPWFENCHLTHLRCLPLHICNPTFQLPSENNHYYISHNRNKIRSNTIRNNFSLTILEIESSNPNLISWIESHSISTRIGSLYLMWAKRYTLGYKVPFFFSLLFSLFHCSHDLIKFSFVCKIP